MASPENITDRAKRYRAQKNVTGPKQCVMCGTKAGQIDVMHLTGNEAHGEKENLAYGCRSCNASLGAAFKKLKLGKPTNQYNPAKKGYPTLQQYMWAVSNHTRGAHDAGGAVIHATPKHKRVEYARSILHKAQETKRGRFEDRWNSAPRSNPSSRGSGRAAGRKLHGASAQRLDRLADAWIKASGYHGSSFDYERDEYRAGLQEADDEYREAKSRVDKAIAKGRGNPAAGSAEVFEDFHGFAPSEVITVTKQLHYHSHLAAAGKLVHLDVWGVDGQGHHVAGFKGAMLAFNEDRNQLFVEGGDQRINLEDFDIRKPHEWETLGQLTDIGYQTNKTHLGDEGGEAVYVHKFRSTNENGKHVVVKIARYPDLIYDVLNEQLLFSGGSYEILREGINK